MISRLVRSVDFERVLRTRTRAASAHFALHHVVESPSAGLSRVASRPQNPELSTEGQLVRAQAVEEFVETAVSAPPAALWLGAVVPKRHARRSVTRTLLKRQIRAAVDRQANRLACGLWIVRLRAPFDRVQFVSAAPEALKRAARVELDGLLARVARREDTV